LYVLDSVNGHAGKCTIMGIDHRTISITHSKDDGCICRSTWPLVCRWFEATRSQLPTHTHTHTGTRAAMVRLPQRRIVYLSPRGGSMFLPANWRSCLRMCLVEGERDIANHLVRLYANNSFKNVAFCHRRYDELHLPIGLLKLKLQQQWRPLSAV